MWCSRWIFFCCFVLIAFGGLDVLPVVVVDAAASPNFGTAERWVQSDNADFVAVASSGSWDKETTWKDGRIPNPSGHVYIPPGKTVTIRTDDLAPVQTINVEGTLRFAHPRTTKLETDLIRVGPTGTLGVGFSYHSIYPQATAEIVFTGGAMVRRAPASVANGIVAEPGSRVEMFGARKTPFVKLRRRSGGPTMYNLRKGRSQLVFEETDEYPHGWRVGDEIVISGTTYERNRPLQDERFRIRSFSTLRTGERVISLGRWSDHTQPAQLGRSHQPLSQAFIVVTNLTRNIVLRSASTHRLQDRGHVLLQTAQVQLQNVEFRRLGRTDKRRLVEIGGLDHNRDGYVNQQGRYALTLFRTMDDDSDPNADPILVQGCVTNTSPGWGFVSHSSRANFQDNVAYGVVGASFVAAAGDEVGLWQGNLAIHAPGNGFFAGYPQFEQGPPQRHHNSHLSAHQAARLRIQRGDLGFSGDGFWIQSPGVEVVDNIAADCHGNAFVVWTQGLYEKDRQEEVGFRTEFLTWDDNYRTFIDPNTHHDGRAVVQDVSMKRFEGNIAFTSFMGIRIRFHNNGNRSFRRNFSTIVTRVSGVMNDATTFDTTTVYNCEFGAQFSYVSQLRFRNLRIHHWDRTTLARVGVNAGEAMINPILPNLILTGYPRGVDLQNVAQFQLPNARITLTQSSTNNQAPTKSRYHVWWKNRPYGVRFPRRAP